MTTSDIHMAMMREKGLRRRKEIKENRKKTIESMHERGCSNKRIAEEIGISVRAVQKLKKEVYG